MLRYPRRLVPVPFFEGALLEVWVPSFEPLSNILVAEFVQDAVKADGGSTTEPEVTGEAEIHPKLTMARESRVSVYSRGIS